MAFRWRHPGNPGWYVAECFSYIIFYDLVVLKINNNNFYVANVIFIQIYVFLVVPFGREGGVEFGIQTCRLLGHNFGLFFKN